MRKAGRNRRQKPAVENGFSLIETLIATAIIAGMLGAVFQVIETGARQMRAVEQRRVAILVAQSQLAAVDAAQSSSFGETRGVTDGVRWRIEVARRPQTIASAAQLDDITVTTGLDSDGRDQFVLKTIRVAR